MKSHILSLSLLFFACLGMAACSEDDLTGLEQTRGMQLTVSCTDIGISRADDIDPDKFEYNENLIETLHYFLYPEGKTNANAVISGTMDIAEGQSGNAIIRVPLNETELNTVLFPIETNSRTCKVYLIANLPDGLITDGSNTSLDALKDLAISTEFNGTETDIFRIQSSFIMDGECTATLISRNKTIAAEGQIELKRLAAKFTTRISVISSFKDTDGKIYTPQVKDMKIHLDNAGENTTLSGVFATDLFDFIPRTRIGTKTEVVDKISTTFSVFHPFYSYPRQWNYDDNALVMYIMLPWIYQQNGETKTQNCYYKVYPSTMQLDRNNWYNLDLNIGVLGSFTNEEKQVEITDFKYKVVDWKNGYSEWQAGVNLETEILSAYYLVMEQNEYVVNNKNIFEIPFISSHECEISDLQVSKKIFVDAYGNPTNEDKYVTDEAIANEWISIVGNNTIKLNHTLNNDFVNTITYDYSPYTFTFKLHHKNNPDKFQERITIKQKPALSITAQLNSYDKPGQQYCGYVFVNGNAPGSTVNGDLPDYGNVKGRNESGNNSNPYMYTIEVSVLPDGSNFILGDPRVKYNFVTDIDAQNNFYSPTSVNGGSNRRLTNYYGTSKDVSTKNMIAPKFRICSAHGWCSGSLVSYKDAFNRAASYQEDGYPAGRWRVPTQAEILFVHKLYTDGFIPSLFYGTYAYWSATGKVNGNTVTNDTSGESPLRCVYDEWYWENSTLRLDPENYNTFTWGDEIE